jgi:L-ascorbate metabolism protein UlaG (beta-lactamase superfamily)
MLLFALRWGVEPSREAPLTLIGPTGLDARLTLLAGAMGDWVRYPDYPMDVVQVRPDQTLALADAVSLEAFKTPHTIESLAYAVRHDGARLVYTGDTGPCDELAAWARGADVLLSECSLPAARAMDIHLTPEQAGRLARAARVRRLILTHRYPMLGAREAAEGAASEFDGEIVVARDGDRFVIERRKDAKTEGPKEETTEGRKE